MLWFVVVVAGVCFCLFVSLFVCLFVCFVGCLLACVLDVACLCLIVHHQCHNTHCTFQSYNAVGLRLCFFPNVPSSNDDQPSVI